MWTLAANFLAAVPGATPAAYPEVRFGPTGSAVYLVSRAGIYSGFAPEAALQVFEPSLAGRQVAVMRDAIFEAGAGAVAKVVAARPSVRRRPRRLDGRHRRPRPRARGVRRPRPETMEPLAASSREALAASSQPSS